jgi:alginate O-acetyltransferase complex protein AlgJ
MANTIRNSLVYRIKDIILISVFVAAVWLPLIGSFFGWGISQDLGEKRVLARLPALGTDPIDAIPEKFEAFYNDHFGFRNRFIRGHNYLRYKLFKGTSYGKVLMGKGDWLFLTKAGIMADYLGQSPLTPEELAGWKEALEQRQTWLAERDIRYLFVVAPNKAMIYPEMLPDHIYRNKGRTRMDQLVEYLHENSAVEILDLRDALRQVKTTGSVYYARDSHWNERGAFIVYREICNRLARWFPDIRPWSMEDFTITIKNRVGDLGTMLGLGEELTQQCEVFMPRKKRESHRVDVTLPDEHQWPEHIVRNQVVAMESQSAKHRLVFFHDSFGNHGGLQEYLGEHFSRITFVPIDFENDCLELMVELEHPDVVIQELVERKLGQVPSPGPGP